MKQGGGFTIVETLIVLAVTGFLLASAILLVNGRQNKTEFQTAINDVQQQIQQVINESASGYFPSNANFTCTAGSGTAPSITSGSKEQGTNGGCIFLGKVMQFGVSDDSLRYHVYSLAGNRQISSGPTGKREVTSLAEAHPKVVDQLTETSPLENGLSAKTMTYSGGASTSGVGFMSTFGSYDTGGSLNSGSTSFGLFSVRGTGLNSTSSAGMVSTINAVASNLIATDSVNICFVSGSTNQSGLITIGGSGSQAVVLKLFTGLTCS